MSNTFIHQPLNSEIRSIGGYYVIAKEVCIPFGDHNIFYVTGYAAFDTSCCGAGGCAFANVPGFVLSWKDKTDSCGLSVSIIEPVNDVGIQNMIREIIRKKEGINQVNFDL
jgi:hypothetical protein